MTPDRPDDAALVRLLPDTPAAHAGLKAARERVRAHDFQAALALLAGPGLRETPLADLLRADLLLGLGRVPEAEALVRTVSEAHGDTAQGCLCAGHAALARGDREAAGDLFARAATANPGRIAARINAAALAPPTAPDHATGAPSPVVAVTSLPPSVDDRHRTAGHSFVAAGFAAVGSVNAPAEIETLRREFPEVSFVAGSDAAVRDFGRPYAALPDLLEAGLAAGAGTVAVINADIVLGPSQGLASRLCRAARGGAVLACRVDMDDLLARSGQYHDVGFDLCAVDAAVAGRLDLEGFFLGLPWWDYALPLAVLAAGGSLGFAAAPVPRHPVHAQAWSHRHFLTLGRRCVRRFYPDAAPVLFPAGETAAGGEAEACLAGMGARTAAFLRRSAPADLGPVRAFCPHDPGYAAAVLPLTRVDFDPA